MVWKLGCYLMDATRGTCRRHQACSEWPNKYNQERTKLLQLHAGWLGRRWAKRVGARVTRDVRERIADELLVPLQQFDASRAALREAVLAADDCS